MNVVPDGWSICFDYQGEHVFLVHPLSDGRARVEMREYSDPEYTNETEPVREKVLSSFSAAVGQAQAWIDDLDK